MRRCASTTTKSSASRRRGRRSETAQRCCARTASRCASWHLWDLEARFQEFCAQDGLALLDLTGPMQAAAGRGEILYAPEDSHWNAEGHRFVAELLARSLPGR